MMSLANQNIFVKFQISNYFTELFINGECCKSAFHVDVERPAISTLDQNDP